MGRLNHQELNALDQARIDLILDYWYDEGPGDGSGGNSHNYPERMIKIRKGIIEDASQDDGMGEQLPLIQKTHSQTSNKMGEAVNGSQQKLPTPSTSSSMQK